jgi:hypothetical protein
VRILLASAAVLAAITIVAAQDTVQKGTATSGQAGGATYLPAHQQHREQQPQGPTGPLDTTQGGAPAASPQGETPSGMQAAPEGADKRIMDDSRRARMRTLPLI